VSEQAAVNLTSLNIVKDEFLATIQLATNQLEQFIGARDRQDLLQGCQEHLQQILGVMRIVQLQGADLLVAEMIVSMEKVPSGADDSYDGILASLSSAAFVLVRYFEYAQQYERSMPVLLLPFINELRTARKDKTLPESQFASMNLEAPREVSRTLSEFSVDGLRRFRHMYQVGLLGVLQGQNADYSLGLMQRALERADSFCAASSFGKTLWAATGALAAAREQGMVFSPARKMLFSALDRQLKQLLKEGETFLAVATDASLLREFVYLAAVSGSDSALVRSIKSHFAVMPLGYTDTDIETELNNLRGPGLSTVHSVAEVIREELRVSKSALEVASQGGVDVIAIYADMISSLTKVADILAVVGLVSPGQVLREQVVKLRQWHDQAHAADNNELMDVADTLLYIESSVSSLQNLNLSKANLAETNAMGKEQIIARSHLAEAEKVVLDEAQAGLSLIKRALASYVESGFDVNHIANLGKSLNSVRGGMILLNMKRAAKVTEACIQFVENHLMRGEAGGAILQLLETFADAVMSLEYFLDAYIAVHKQDESILDIAEESVRALGCPIE
jgi:hypothetical protein